MCQNRHFIKGNLFYQEYFSFSREIQAVTMKNNVLLFVGLVLLSFQMYAQGEFITRWNLANSGSGPNQITFNATVATGGANFTWETIPAGTSGSGTLAAGTSLRTISGIPTGATIRLNIEPQNLQRFFINSGGDRQRIVDIEQWGAAPWTSMENAFFGCNNLNISATDIPILSGVSNMAQMFRSCAVLNGPSNIGQWNVSTVADMQGMFRSAFAFNQNLSNWNTANVVNMSTMFRTASAFNQNLGSWTLSNAVNMSAMLEGAGLDCENYSNTLIGWAANNPLIFNRTLDASSLNYGIQAISARNTLVTSRGWTITDSGMTPCGGEYITKWNLANPGSGPNQITFNATVNTGGAPFYWETIPAGTTGSGTLAAGTSFRTISGIPTGATIRLYIASQNLQHFNISSTNNRQRLVDVESWGNANWISMQNSFQGCNNLQISATDLPNLTGVSDFSNMFMNCTILNGPANINSWNMSNATNLSFMFSSAHAFNQNINSWNVGNVTNMAKIFSGQSPMVFNQPLNNWDVANVTDMNHMFERASFFNQDIGNWNTSNVTNMAGMFANCQDFNQPLNNWNTSSVTNMQAMFANCHDFNQPLNNWNTTNVSNMHSMFRGASQFNQPLNNWNTSNVTNMAGMFKLTDQFNQNIENWNVSQVTDMESMFEAALLFNQPLNSWNTENVTNMMLLFAYTQSFNQPIGNWNTSNVNVMYGTFADATSFNQPLSSWNTSNVSDMTNLFYGASSFNQPLNNWNVSNVVSMQNMFLGAISFNQPLNNWDVSNVSSMSAMFWYASSFNQSLGSWVLSPNVDLNSALGNSNLDCENYSNTLIGWAQNNPTVTNRNLGAQGIAYTSNAIAARNQLLAQGWTITDAGMTGPCNAFKSTWNLSNTGSGPNQITFNATVATGGANFTWETIPAGTSGSGTLVAGTSLRTISGIPTGATIRLSIEPQNLQRFFFNNAGDRQRIVDIEQWGAAPWTSMENAFFGCNNLNISATDIPILTSVSNMAQMFRSCTSLNGPTNIGQWNVSGVSDMQGMFRAATSFNQDVSTWNVSSVLNMFALFRTASAFNQNLGSWTLSNAVNMSAMLEGAGLDCENYASTLIGWAANNPTALNKTLDAQGIGYAPHAITARNTLINNQGWTINDAGMNTCGAFVTVWDMNHPGSGPNNFGFSAEIAAGGTPFFWETIPAGTSGSGVLPAGVGNKNIGGIPSGATIRLFILPNNLEKLYINNGPNRLRIVDVEQWGSMPWISTHNMFYGCQHLNVSATDVPDLSNTSTMEGMFRGCWSLNGPSNINSWDVSSVTNMSYMFSNALVFNQSLDSWDVSSATNMSYMFEKAEAFNQSLDPWDVSIVTNMSYMFSRAAFNQSLENWNTSNVTNMSGMFSWMNYNQNITTWNTSNVTNMSEMFYRNFTFNQPIGTWNTISVTNMTRMFSYSTFNQPIGTWNTTSVTYLSYMFSHNAAFNQPIGAWDVSNVLSMGFMFEYGPAVSFNQNLGAWVFHPNVQILNAFDRVNWSCQNYTLTLQGWAQNNPNIFNRSVSLTPSWYSSPMKRYSNEAIAARNQLISQGWAITGDALMGENPHVLPANEVQNGLNLCEPFISPSNTLNKLLYINPNGNTVNFNNMSATVRNAFVASIPSGITTETSANSGYYNYDNGSNVFRVSRRMFTIQSSDTYPNNGGVLVRVYYDPNDFSSMLNDPASVSLNDFGWFKSSSHIPQNIVNEMSLNEPMLASAIIIEDVTYGTEAGVHYAEFLVESFSTFGMYAKHKFGPLPVTLTAFNANCQGETIQLNWSTASEFNASHYVIQNSRDGSVWTDLAEVNAAGTTNQTTNYSIETQNFGGLSYFRLVQVDLDGATEIFGPISANCELQNNQMSVYPNPTADNFTVRIETTQSFENATLELIDNMGRVVLSRTIDIESGTTTIPFESEKLQAGVYVIRMRGEGEEFKPVQVVRM